MDKNQLKNFILLAQALNFSNVAKQSFISQPALTNQISKLEAELGVRLFYRTKHSVSLTYAGGEFYDYAADILERIDKAEKRMNDISLGRTGFLKLSAVTSAEWLMGAYVAEFSRRYPDIQISMDSGTGAQQIMAINRQAFDIYFSFASLLESSGTLETLPAPPDRYAIYISRSLAASADMRDLGRLRGMTHLAESSAEGPFLISQIHSVMNKAGLDPEKTMYFPNSATIMVAVQAGLGYAILPSKVNLGTTPSDVAVIPIPGDDTRIENSVGWHRNTRKVAALKFIEIVKARSLPPQAPT